MLISISSDGAFLASDNITPHTYINLTLSAQLNLFNHILQSAQSPEEAQAMKEDLYDMFNKAASAFLEAFAPDLELRPDLTAEAILKAENTILDTNVQDQSAIQQSAARIHEQMVRDGLVKPAKMTEDGTVIPFNREERRRYTPKK